MLFLRRSFRRYFVCLLPERAVEKGEPREGKKSLNEGNDKRRPFREIRKKEIARKAEQGLEKAEPIIKKVCAYKSKVFIIVRPLR